MRQAESNIRGGGDSRQQAPEGGKKKMKADLYEQYRLAEREHFNQQAVSGKT